MKRLLILGLVVSCLSCADNIKSEDHNIDSKRKIGEVNNKKSDFGLFIVNLKELTNSDEDTILFLIDDNSIAITKRNLICNEKSYDLFETSNSTWDSIFRPKVFNPESDILYIEGYKNELFIEDKKVAFEGKSKYISFISYETFLKSTLVGLTKENPLLKNHNNDNLVDENYTEYYYEVIRFKNDWVQLKSETESSGEIVNGWAKWLDNSKDKPKMLLEIIYNI